MNAEAGDQRPEGDETYTCAACGSPLSPDQADYCGDCLLPLCPTCKLRHLEEHGVSDG